MEMKRHLIEIFRYNDYANRLALAKVFEMRDADRGGWDERTDECIKFFSHLINSMNKWLGRIEKWGESTAFPKSVSLPIKLENHPVAPTTPSAENNPVTEAVPPILRKEGSQDNYTEMDWWLPVYRLEELASKWDECLRRWVDFIDSKSEEELFQEVEFYGFDGGDWAAVIKDIALQLNYHSIHHRAQIQYLIRQQGIEPDFVDYIGTKYRKLS